MCYNVNNNWYKYTKKMEEITMRTNINIPEDVRLAVAETEMKKQRDQWYDTVRKVVAGKQAVGKYFADLSVEMAEMVSDSSEEIKVVPVKDNSDRETGYYAIFNLCEIEGREWSDSITMEVPEGKIGLFCGAAKWHLKDWTRTSWLRKFGVRRINLV